jgi:Tfp pilus assembly protein PilN
MLPNKYVVYGILALIAIAVGTTYFIMWKASIKQQALLEFNNKQLEQVIEEQKLFNENMKALSASSKVIIETMSQKNEEVSTKLKNLEDYLTEQESKQTTESSEVLKRTIIELGGK